MSPAPGVQLPRGPVRFEWSGARNADGYELEIDDHVVAGGLSREQLSTTFNVVVGAAGGHSWRVAAVNQFGRTLSERRAFTLAPRAPVVLVAGCRRKTPRSCPPRAARG